MPDKICGRKIGIMGGTFNPIHNGHLYLAQAALEQAVLDAVIFMPSGQSYMKAGTDVLNGDIRLDMVKLAIAGNPSFTFSDMEIKRTGNTYTYETLTILKKAQPYDTFYFIVGADSLFSMENWKEPQEIFDKCIVLAAMRENMDKVSMQKKVSQLQEKFGAVIRLLEFPKTDISSCFIRQQVALGKDISHLVPKEVRHYIKEHKLYQ
ncbi:MAG: nicotinate-nucleotide adenylyltransferase [Lachnospiraceae bacterium]|nr:nicotinate-nucleotide adenylyltransferase [Lachnospiraceae bacterium]MBQ7781266.1 nicotinate-nucleotide adenylyltransferase [Lachnospiraceae bacterium]